MIPTPPRPGCGPSSPRAGWTSGWSSPTPRAGPGGWASPTWPSAPPASPVLADLRGDVDAYGNELVVTQVAVGDELAAAGDLVKGKLAGVPVAVARGLIPGRDRPTGPAADRPIRSTRPHDR